MFKMPNVLKFILWALIVVPLLALALTIKVITLGCFQMEVFFDWIDHTWIGVVIRNLMPD